MPDKMIVTKAKLDALANSIATKSGESIPLTIAEMKAAVDGLTVGGVVISDTTDSHGGTVRTITAQNAINLQTKTITPTSSSQTISPDTGYDGFSQVTVEAASGQSSPTFGVITTINITQSVSLITYDLSSTALSYGMVWVYFDDVQFSAQDWLYCSVLDSTNSPVDNNGYTSKRSSFTGMAICSFGENKTINQISLPGYSGVSFEGSISSSRINHYNSLTPSTLKIKLYTSGVTIDSGTITVYGRVS